ncbi:MAG: NAD(P)H-dependent oxidoreductase subunit E [Candidatus Izimaplasma sp.]|nr:NAD(P)H-dependent oxidoreductase subunit E [Candidatus Izimaplasma bacterium]
MGKKFEITDENREELLKEIKIHLKSPGPLLPILHSAQRIFKCIPIPVQKLISEYTDVSIAEINGIVTFYSSFSLYPKGKHVLGVCLGTPCYVRGSQIILDAVKNELGINVGETTKDGYFTLEAIRCIGTCGMAPVMSFDEEVYGEVDVTKAKRIIKNARGK